ncbi:C40 family peptidase [Pyramidobacter piscolens]|uniref:C40 family peptidase n=1 Tax=Pyramidobacter piscolens TaxID=638849 RepID=UPI002AAFB4F7|nr:C40 family peptidase [Pyramidobacter piscolens]
MITPFDHLYPEIAAHMAAAYPREGCGLVVDGRFVPVENTAEGADEFAMPADTVLRYPRIDAVIHSHPDGPDCPSEADMRGQLAMAVPWGLCTVSADKDVSRPWYWGADEFTPPLVGREFRHGPSGSDGAGDCYALIRDWYRLERGAILPEFPRSDGWWNDGLNLYADHFREAGFREIPASEARDGDVFFMKVLSSRENHAGIMTGGSQLILHHLSGRLSRQEPMGRWHKFIERWVRYEP